MKVKRKNKGKRRGRESEVAQNKLHQSAAGAHNFVVFLAQINRR